MSNFSTKKVLFAIVIPLCFLSISTALAKPTLTIDTDQTFSQSQGLTELKAFTVTDVDGGEITAAYGVKISIPDAYPAVFDSSYSAEQFVLYGTAVDNGKVDANAEITFTDKNKSVVIPVLEDFEAGEILTIGRLWLKDIYTSSSSQHPALNYGSNKYVYSSKYLAAWSSSNQDNRAPDAPYNPTIEIIDGNQVKLTWEDSYDLDISQIEILRGKNTAASGLAYVYEGIGIEEYVDADVEIGDVMEYYVLATDGRNRSDLGEVLTITVTEYQEVVEDDVETATGETAVDDTEIGTGETVDDDTETSTGETVINDAQKIPSAVFDDTVLTDFSMYNNPFPDIELTTLEGQASAELYRRDVIGGYPDGEFKGNNDVNRAEAAKFLLMARYGEVDEVGNNGQFSDVFDNRWYTKYVVTAADKGIISGHPDGSFQPAATVNTAEFLKMLTLTFDLQLNLKFDYTDFAGDVWFAQYAGAAQEYNLFPDRGTTVLNPAKTLTRDEVAVAIYQYLKNRK